MGLVVRHADQTHTHLVSLAEELQKSVVFLTHPVFQTVHRLDQLMFLQACDSLMWLQNVVIQVLQKLCPQDVVTGLLNTSRQMEQEKFSSDQEVLAEAIPRHRPHVDALMTEAGGSHLKHCGSRLAIFTVMMDDSSSRAKLFRGVVVMGACHMGKLARNVLQAYSPLTSTSGQINWRYVVHLNDVQTKHGLHATNRVTDKHVSFDSQKMKVSLAAHTLVALSQWLWTLASHSVNTVKQQLNSWRYLSVMGFIINIDTLMLMIPEPASASAGGWNNNPSASQFQAIFRHLTVRCGVSPSTSGNVAAQDETVSLSAFEMSSSPAAEETEELPSPFADVPALSYHLLTLKNKGGLMIPSEGTVKVVSWSHPVCRVDLVLEVLHGDSSLRIDSHVGYSTDIQSSSSRDFTEVCPAIAAGERFAHLAEPRVTAASQTLSTQHLVPGVKSLWVVRIRLILFSPLHLPEVLRQRETSVGCVWVQCESTGI
ncbi:hypothetical protein N1851_010235 [Merluccius polli]|uniref:Transposable element P transposase-like GTP-binding insertion domain-containing protein n=1 Tax=Merluccius polli TaxID=89951 RepID=A0AA47P6E8_MERPO|nr:hypothetical protein N1851_010235 [Merluccius polli]